MTRMRQVYCSSGNGKNNNNNNNNNLRKAVTTHSLHTTSIWLTTRTYSGSHLLPDLFHLQLLALTTTIVPSPNQCRVVLTNSSLIPFQGTGKSAPKRPIKQTGLQYDFIWSLSIPHGLPTASTRLLLARIQTIPYHFYA